MQIKSADPALSNPAPPHTSCARLHRKWKCSSWPAIGHINPFCKRPVVTRLQSNASHNRQLEWSPRSVMAVCSCNTYRLSHTHAVLLNHFRSKPVPLLYNVWSFGEAFHAGSACRGGMNQRGEIEKLAGGNFYSCCIIYNFSLKYYN